MGDETSVAWWVGSMRPRSLELLARTYWKGSEWLLAAPSSEVEKRELGVVDPSPSLTLRIAGVSTATGTGRRIALRFAGFALVKTSSAVSSSCAGCELSMPPFTTSLLPWPWSLSSMNHLSSVSESQARGNPFRESEDERRRTSVGSW